MNQQRAQELVVGCLAASAAVSAGSSLASGDTPGMRLVVGYAFTGVGLATVALFAPDLAGGLAALILTTTVFVYGEPLMNAITSFTGTGTTTTRAPQTPRTPEGTLSI